MSVLQLPHGPPDERFLLLSDILPTAWHANEMGEVGPGDCVAIWGAGPVGILAAHCAQYMWVV
jgi:threonine dehydrogenase-like Zn-dependent dehydrogenase